MKRRQSGEGIVPLDALLGGLSRHAVCRACGLSLGTFRRWERGQALPRTDAVMRLASLLGRDPVKLSRPVLGHDLVEHAVFWPAASVPLPAVRAWCISDR